MTLSLHKVGKQTYERNKVVLPGIADLIYSHCLYHFMLLIPRFVPLVHAFSFTSRLTYLIGHWISSLGYLTGITRTTSKIKLKIFSRKPGPCLVFLIPVNDTIFHLVMQDRIPGVILVFSIFLTLYIPSITKPNQFNLFNIS